MGCAPSRNPVIQANSKPLVNDNLVNDGPNKVDTNVANPQVFKETSENLPPIDNCSCKDNDAKSSNVETRGDKCIEENNEKERRTSSSILENLQTTSIDLKTNILNEVTPKKSIPTTEDNEMTTCLTDSIATATQPTYSLLELPQPTVYYNDESYPANNNSNNIASLVNPEDLREPYIYDNVVETDEQATLDVIALNDVLQHFNINENQLINLIVPRSYSYRQLLREKFYNEYAQDLVKLILQKTSSTFQYLIAHLLSTIEEFLSSLLRTCVVTSNYLLSTEVLTAWKTSLVEKAKEVYFKVYETTFADDLYGTLNNHVAVSMKNIMIPLSRLKREEIRESPEDDETTVQIENSFMNQSTEYISSLLTTQPYSTVTLDTLCRNYCLKYGIPITESIDIEFHDDTRLALKKIVSICEDEAAYFCNELSVAVLNRQERRVMDILIGRSEIDLSKIVFNFKRNGIDLSAQISEMFSSNTNEAIQIMLRKI